MHQKRFSERRSGSKFKKHSLGHSSGNRQERARAMQYKYLDKAKDALSMGDRIAAEHNFQYADHYARLIEDSFAYERSNNQDKRNYTKESDNNYSSLPEQENLQSDEAKDQHYDVMEANIVEDIL